MRIVDKMGRIKQYFMLKTGDGKEKSPSSIAELALHTFGL